MPTHRDMPQNAPTRSESAGTTPSPGAPAREPSSGGSGGLGKTLGAIVGIGLIALGGVLVDQHLRPPLAIPAATPPALRPTMGLVQQCPAWATYEVNGFWFCESNPYPRAGTDSPPCLAPDPKVPDWREDRAERRDKVEEAHDPHVHERYAVRRHEFQFKPENTRCRPGLASQS